MAAMGRVAWSFSTPSCLSLTRYRISGTWSAICKAQVIKPRYHPQNPFLRFSGFSGLCWSRRPKSVVKPLYNGDWLRRYISAVITDKSQKSTEEAIRENIPKRVVGDVYHSFQLVQEEYIPDIDSIIRKYVHTHTGAQLMSVLNKEENKTFGVVFRTPPSNSRGTPHILEHSVLCGSRKYPVKEPFVELMKSSLNTFLNAFTFPDKTCYPVASCNLKDFYNLVDVYLDAVFYPNLTPDVLKQEGHHFELLEENAPITIQGVVYNEMKGVFSNPDSVIGSWSQRCLFPENTYGVESGGDPQEIPDLSWREFQDFYRRLYHPSNTRFWFYGDDPEDMRLEKLEEYLKDFKKLSVDSRVQLQSRWTQPKHFTFGYDAGNDNLEKKHMATVNWMLADVITDDPTKILALSLLDHLLTGTSASPLRKTLTDSGLGEEVIGSGIETDLRQVTYSIGLKGMAKEGCQSLENLVLDTLKRLSKDGFSQGEIESSLNTIEFMLKEQNTGSFPKGLALMLRSLTTWLHDSDPLIPLKFEIPLQQLKEILQKDRRYLNLLIEEHFIRNTHRAYVSLVPDPDFATKEVEKEMKRIEDFRKTLDKSDIQQLIEETKRLKEKQIAPDDPAQLAKIPALKKSDIDQKAPMIPRQVTSLEDTTVLLTPLFTNGIVYFDMAINIRQLPAHLLSYVPLFGECLLELGTTKEDFVSLQQRIGRETGGIRHSIYCSQMDVPNSHVGGYGPAVAQFIIRGKVMSNKTHLLFDILRDVLFDIDLNNKDRFRQILIEEKSGVESSISPSGHRVAASRLNAQYTNSGWADEQMGGISYLQFLSRLADRLDSEWDSIRSDLEALRSYLVSKAHMTLQVTTDERTFESSVAPSLRKLLQPIPKDMHKQSSTSWEEILEKQKRNEGIIVPSTVNYVGKGANLFQLGYQPNGASLLAMKYLGISYLWERIRVQGGAYGAFGRVDLRTGQLIFLSYRDPHVKKTLDTYDNAAAFLSQAQLSSEEIERCIIGVIGDMDSYQLPDAKGFTNLIRYLSGVTQERIQERREQVLTCTNQDLVQFGSVLQSVASNGSIVAVGNEQALQQANAQGLDLRLFRATEQ
ncbi:Zn-dependent peptidase [Galdieria sulphuraria]|uniref:Zn-dependent peptidase n=1 Tax=Galdieria sulphuraria TaxID=130081 RepID=M2XJH9_GALSU|nr:Zn-dependent peptidase [Galdieria sulphuraria]EME30272.1 Zn-dependent peptidase [Galdieria sulphuraria]|eukprot:XP_005706792.1 Zn-dependent peptidase [Galdieria sulphuraria]